MHDLNSALLFVKVVEHGSFTAAARELRLPKSTISRTVHNRSALLTVWSLGAP